MRKRCIFCLKKLDDKNRCRNKRCPDYIRTHILDKADAEKAEKPSVTGDPEGKPANTEKAR